MKNDIADIIFYIPNADGSTLFLFKCYNGNSGTCSYHKIQIKTI